MARDGPLRTCQKQQTDKSRCKFFLWDSDAHPREAAALANNTRTEPAFSDPRTPSKRPASPPPPYAIETENSGPSRKRARATVADLDDEYNLEAADDAFNDELNQIMAAVETPRKAARTDEFTTPSTRRTLPWSKDHHIAANASGLQTPHTGRTISRNQLSPRLEGPLFTPPRPVDDALQTATPTLSLFETPTPARFKNVRGDGLVQDVLSLLKEADIKLSSTTAKELSSLLLKHAKTAEGLQRGRDVARTTIKARDAKITELIYRISTLEAELEAEKAMVKHLQWEAQPEG
ncbi:hypothetical protein N0V94_000860 [Neodidymelliopsis sp. IMI 364377]|nr:hypothetical protein N0V94_000860 [Neodidymelliopsis sp. IMI 364377]